MTIAELLLEDFDAEMNNTRRTLERIPEHNPEYKPHEKSMAIGKLAMHVASLPHFGLCILEDPSMDMAKPTRPRVELIFQSREHLLATFDQQAAACRAALSAASDDHLTQPWRFSFGEYLISDETRSKTYRLMFFNHLVHHRAQLGVYLRLNELPVPGLYGPSADEPFTP